MVSATILHSEEDSFTKWAAAHALPVATLDFSADYSDLLPLKSVVGAARVVALGEPTHGAHEPLAFRNRLARFLVEQMGFTGVALESGFTESRSVEEFVRGGPGDAQSVALHGLTSGFGHLIANRELIQWMRDYNAAAAKTGQRRIHFYGVDLTAGGRISGPRRAIDDALAFIERADSAEEVREKPFMMGSYLRRAFGNDLLIIATSSATSSGGLPPPEPIEDNIDDALARVGLPRMILDLRTAQQDPEAIAWVSKQRALHRHISSHVLITPATAVDAFFFVDGLTPAVIVPF